MGKPLQCVALAVALRVIMFSTDLTSRLSRSIEVTTPVTSILRLKEAFWLKQLGLSPYAGNAYHGSPLLLDALGPIVSKSFWVFLLADLGAATLLYMMARSLFKSRKKYASLLKLPCGDDENGRGEIVALLYLLNPLTIISCVGGSTSPIENFMVLLAMYAAVAGNVPLAALGWVVASHISMYPLILLLPIVFALTNGPDRPPSKLLKMKPRFSWWPICEFIFWLSLWSACIFGLCSRSLHQHGGIYKMLTETYGFILSVQDLSPNIGIYWYFFTEVFEFYRPLFLVVFHANILCVVVPLSIRFHHRPVFLAFVLMAIASMLKSYPSVGDAALYLGMMGLFFHEISDFKYSFLLLNGYMCIFMLGPVMYNLWISRGTGNANFYFATTLVYALLQMILIVESINSVLRHDRSIKATLLQPAKLTKTEERLQRGEEDE